MAQNVKLNQGPRCNSKSCSGESVGQNGASLSGITASHASFDPSAKQCPPELIDGKILWGHPDGYFLNARGQKVKHDFGPAMQKNEGGSKYPKMRSYGNKLCHHLMYEAFYEPRKKGMEIDHLNGNKLDYRPSNLQEVTPAENDRRIPYLRALREAIPMHAQTFQREDYLRWFAMPLEDFKALLATLTPCDPHEIMEYEMTHHMEV